MPVFEMPLDDLRRYTGSNPRPDDFDRYWDQALDELLAVDSGVQWVPNDTLPSRSAECFDLWFTGVGGARVHAKYLRPRQRNGPVPAVLRFHGYAGHGGDWSDKLAWVAEGYAVAALDCRGQGGLSQDVGGTLGSTIRGHIVRGLDDPDARKLLFRNIFLDCAQLARLLMELPEIDPKRVSAVGGSQGGGLALACAALEPRIQKVASVYPFLCDYQRVWEMDLCQEAYEELRQHFRWFDPRHERENEVFTRLGYIDCQHLAPRIQAKVLMITALMDRVCPPSTQFAAYNRLRTDKRMVLYPDFGHEVLPDQNDLILRFLQEA